MAEELRSDEELDAFINQAGDTVEPPPVAEEPENPETLPVDKGFDQVSEEEPFDINTMGLDASDENFQPPEDGPQSEGEQFKQYLDDVQSKGDPIFTTKEDSPRVDK